MEAMIDSFLTADGLVALVTLTAMEIVLGIDNVVFIAILTGRLPGRRQVSARRLGLVLALGIRILLLLAITWMMGLTRPLFSVLGQEVSGRDLILFGGGLFLIFKATWEIYDKVEAEHAERPRRTPRAAFALVILQILVLDIVFSLDSVIPAPHRRDAGGRGHGPPCSQGLHLLRHGFLALRRAPEPPLPQEAPARLRRRVRHW